MAKTVTSSTYTTLVYLYMWPNQLHTLRFCSFFFVMWYLDQPMAGPHASQAPDKHVHMVIFITYGPPPTSHSTRANGYLRPSTHASRALSLRQKWKVPYYNPLSNPIARQLNGAVMNMCSELYTYKCSMIDKCPAMYICILVRSMLTHTHILYMYACWYCFALASRSHA